MRIWVCGEVLVDILPKGAVIGGGPANTAKSLAILGHRVEFIAGISTDEYGERIHKELLGQGVRLNLSMESERPTATARVILDERGNASYGFEVVDTATFDFRRSWLPDPVHQPPCILHIGSLATIVEPGWRVLHEWAASVAQLAPIVFDPNIRPSIMDDRARYQEVVERWVSISKVVKVSEGDLAWLFPDRSPIEIAKTWLALGTQLIVVTRGSDGILAVTPNEVQEVIAAKVDVVDTVGAGDTVGAIVVDAIMDRGISNLRGEYLRQMLQRASVAASITCSRAGARPPSKPELNEVLKDLYEGSNLEL